MVKKILIVIFGILVGTFIGYLLSYQSPISVLALPKEKKQIIGFLPYWLLDKAKTDYSKYITTLTYFGLRVDNNGDILKLATPQQEEPGWYALESGKLDPVFANTRKQKISLSLLVNSGSVPAIDSLISTPNSHADNLVSDVSPIMNRYGFSDLNLDIEYTSQASPEARRNFTKFVAEIKKKLPNNTLTLEVAPGDVIKQNLIDISAVSKIADNIVIMAYDFHSTDSFVSGPVAPLSGAGVMSEYDVTSAAENALKSVQPKKLILGIPLYGYEWESLGSVPRSAIIPNSGVVASNSRAESLTISCSSCSVNSDEDAVEQYISYFDTDSNAYHIIFYPDYKSTSAKLKLANTLNLEGVALWALGYEGNSILNPVVVYKNQ